MGRIRRRKEVHVLKRSFGNERRRPAGGPKKTWKWDVVEDEHQGGESMTIRRGRLTSVISRKGIYGCSTKKKVSITW